MEPLENIYKSLVRTIDSQRLSLALLLHQYTIQSVWAIHGLGPWFKIKDLQWPFIDKRPLSPNSTANF